ncbi:MAG: hypothetical protein IJ770_04225 [Alphaproteobacteria bacterium]|nr:hypothetical protein [Alphaproteobacteria bacterium]
MAKLPFTDKYGRITYNNPEDAYMREHTYILLGNGSEIVCIYNKTEKLYTLPTDNDLQINGNLVSQFSTLSYFTENKHPIKELQTFLVYAVEKQDLPDSSFQWCRLEDILVNNIPFDATKLKGIKNLYVRIKEL